MNKLGSEFFKAIDQFERGIIGGATWRQVVMVVGIVFGVLLATVISLLKLPSLLFYLSLALTVPPAFVYGINKVQERAYQTEYESEENHGTFIPEKGIHEWNDFN